MNNYEKRHRYFEMYDRAIELEKEMREYLATTGLTIYGIFISVGNEEKETYFVDIEVGGSSKTYQRIYGQRTEEDILKIMKRK